MGTKLINLIGDKNKDASFNLNKIAVVGLFSSYFLCRSIFQQFTELKAAFIYPTGYVVKAFFGIGEYGNSEWFFNIGPTQFVLGESCSGTTFFSLLLSYFVYKYVAGDRGLYWLFWIWPITVLANSIRVISAIYMHQSLSHLNNVTLSENAHVMTGVLTFATVFFTIAFLLNEPRKWLKHE